MGWLQIIMLVIELIKLIRKLKDSSEREALFGELGQHVETAVSGKDRGPLKRLRDRVRQRCSDCGVK